MGGRWKKEGRKKNRGTSNPYKGIIFSRPAVRVFNAVALICLSPLRRATVANSWLIKNIRSTRRSYNCRPLEKAIERVPPLGGQRGGCVAWKWRRDISTCSQILSNFCTLRDSFIRIAPAHISQGMVEMYACFNYTTLVRLDLTSIGNYFRDKEKEKKRKKSRANYYISLVRSVRFFLNFFDWDVKFRLDALLPGYLSEGKDCETSW